MPLRTVTLEPGARLRRRTPQEWKREVARVAGAATAAARSGSARGIRSAFAALGEYEDAHRAHQARLAVLEAVFSTPAHGRWADVYLAAAESLLDTLAASPAEPVLLNAAGVILYELGGHDGAEALFRAALRLDPDLPHVENNLEQLRARRRGAATPKALRVRVRPLEARARRVAAAAHPARGLTLSLCMIVKDEQELLPGCLAPVADAVDELVVVDTGSSDDTVAIAESFGARIVHFPWNGSFADARNVSLEHATGDWILYLDADEHLVAEDAPKLRELLGRTWREAFYLVETNYVGGDESGSAVAHLALRLFRNRPDYRFEGRIHEQKTQSMPTYLPERFETTAIRLVHYGYLRSRIGARQKSQRNIELLEREAAEAPGPFVDFNLGSEHVALGDFMRARIHLDRAWAELKREGAFQLGYAPMLASRVVQARRESGDTAAARAAIAEALALYPDNTELVLQQALCARDDGDGAEAARLAERCVELGDPPARYGATVGSGTYLPLALLGELHAAKGRHAEAEALFRRVRSEHPAYTPTVLPLAQAMLARGAAPAEVLAEAPVDRPSARLLAATALYEAGHPAEAEPAFRDVLERQPANDAARIGLVECLLAQRRHADAAAEAAAVPADSPLVAAAAEAIAFAHAARGDAAALSGALARSGGTLPPHDRALFAAWAALLQGERAPALPLAAAPTAARVLEALLRVRDLDGFARALPLLEATGLADRERREQLAGIYLRRGFLESAADEWLAVAGAEPDARALVGLAQVAHACGLAEDARVFARAAAELEPDGGRGTTLLDALERRAS